MRSMLIGLSAAALSACAATPAPQPSALAAATAQPPKVILVGDSTIAPKSGWGDGFCAELAKEASCLNLAKGGRSSKSYRSEGSWATAMAEIAKPNAGVTYVIISFGHNDQPNKSDRATNFATEFAPNMTKYITDIREAGGMPILLTPLTRRQFKSGMLTDGLSPWAAAIRDVARETNTPLLDLASDSVRAVQAMGPVEAMRFAAGQAPPEVVEAAKSGATIEAPKTGNTPAPGLTDAERAARGNPQGVFDYTHLGPVGERYFAAMVRGEVERALPQLARWLKPKA